MSVWLVHREEGQASARLLPVTMEVLLPVAWTYLRPFHSDLRHTREGRIKHSARFFHPQHTSLSSEPLLKLLPLLGAPSHLLSPLHQRAGSSFTVSTRTPACAAGLQVEGLFCDIFSSRPASPTQGQGLYLSSPSPQALVLGLIT